MLIPHTFKSPFPPFYINRMHNAHFVSILCVFCFSTTLLTTWLCLNALIGRHIQLPPDISVLIDTNADISVLQTPVAKEQCSAMCLLVRLHLLLVKSGARREGEG